MALFSNLIALLRSDRQADRVVPPSGFTANLTVFAAGAMAFLAVFALALSNSTDRLSRIWGEELAASATLRILAPQGEEQAQVDAALRILETAAGVVQARPLEDAEQRDLLTPWLGAELDIDDLPLPRLIALDLDLDAFDAAGLRLRLAAEVPGAVLDDHARWRAPLADAAAHLRFLGWIVAVLIATALAAIVTLAANAALAANARVIAVLRLIGATDAYIAGAFVRRFTLRALIGALVGMALGIVAIVTLPGADAGAGALLTDFGFQGAGWILPALVPVVTGTVAFVATALAARKALEDLA